jgi:Winged helix DNA-binding domain
MSDTAAVDRLLHRRLRHQHLVAPVLRDAADVVRSLGAMQAQEFAPARWAIGLRTKNVRDGDVVQAFDDGAILRTHVMRPTWHFVSPRDIRWLLALTAPRVRAATAYYDRLHGIDAPRVRRAQVVIERALNGGRHLTRTELAARLEADRLPSKGPALAHLIMHAELDGLICSGPRRAKQFTYALLDERVPRAPLLPREEALATLTVRYFTSHGPATVRDYAWWSGLTAREAREGIEATGSALEQEATDGLTCWSARTTRRGSRTVTRPFVRLLPIYDEYLIAYKDRHPLADRRRPVPRGAFDRFAHYLVIDGRLSGSWRQARGRDGIEVHVRPFGPLTRAESRALAGEVGRLGEFLGLQVALRLDS